MMLSSRVVLVIYAIVAVVLFYGSLKNDFMIDDFSLFLNRPRPSGVQEIIASNFPALSGGQSSNVEFYFRPVMNILPMAQYQIFGKNPVPFHVTNLILFVMSAFCVYLFTAKVFNDRTTAFWTGFVYTIHPLNAIMVNYIIAGAFAVQVAAMCLAAVFFLSAIERRTWGRYAASLAFFVLAVWSHDSALALPAYLALILWVKRVRWDKRLILTLAPFATVSLYGAVMKFHHASSMASALGALGEQDAWTHWVNVARLLGWYAEKFVLLDGIVFIWMTPPLIPGAALWGLGGMAAVGLSIWALLKKNVTAYAAGCWLIGWVLVFLACRFEASHGYQIEPHWLVFSSVGFFAAGADAVRRVLGSGAIVPVAVGWFLAIGYPAGMVYQTAQQNRVWDSEVKYCRYWAEQAPHFATPHSYLANYYMDNGFYDEALDAFKTAIMLNPRAPQFYYQLGQLYQFLGQTEEARVQWAAGLKYAPDSVLIREALEVFGDR